MLRLLMDRRQWRVTPEGQLRLAFHLRGDHHAQGTISSIGFHRHEIFYGCGQGGVRKYFAALYRIGVGASDLHKELLQPTLDVFRAHCSLCGGRDYAEWQREHRVGTTLGHSIAPHKPMLRAVSPQHGRYLRRSTQSGVYGDPWREAISASGALNRPRRRCGGRIASMASSFSDGSARR